MGAQAVNWRPGWSESNAHPGFCKISTKIGVNSAMSNLQDEIGSLSAAEKLELLDVLWVSLEAELPALTTEQQDELNYRVAGYEQHRADVIPWEQVRANLFKKQ